MCGLAGVVAWENRYRLTRDLLDAMSAAVAHRGPDGQGTYLNHEAAVTRGRPQCGLVHRRLAVLDLDPRALQPFDDERSRRWLVFNGEIYNFRELAAELSKLHPDYKWRTTCDTEVLLLAYSTWGQTCLDRLNGMFAFAVWDETDGSLFLARDRMGQKPLYYALAPERGGIAFASELSALRKVPWVSDAIDPQAITDYLCWGYVPAPRTIYQAAAKLMPAHWMRLDAQQIHSQRYFDPNAAVRASGADSESQPDAPHLTRKLLKEAVHRRLVADVPLGCFLSGGIDSSIIAACMKASVPHDQSVLTFSIGFEDKRYDESRYAAAVARHLGTQHQTFMVQPHAAEDLPKLAAVFGEPFGDSSALPTHYLSRETRQHVKVALSGDGGDELFGGYDRYRAMALSQRLRHLPWPLRRIVAWRLWQGLPGTHPKGRLTRLKRLLAGLREPPRQRYPTYLRLFDDATLWNLLGPELQGPWYASRDWLSGEFGNLWDCDEVRAALAVDRVTYLPEDLLTKVDRASMLHALEVRSPFMDVDLVQFAATLSARDLIGRGSKTMLREAFARDLPSKVFRRRKMGFAVPIGRWLRGELKPMLHDLLFASDSFAAGHFQQPALQKLVEEHETGRVDHSQRLYALLMLELWWRIR